MSNPAEVIMRVCISLARADTHTSALDWYDVPIVELTDWVETVNGLEKKRK